MERQWWRGEWWGGSGRDGVLKRESGGEGEWWRGEC